MMLEFPGRTFPAVLALLGGLLVPGCLDEHVVRPDPVPIERLTPAYRSTYSGLREYTRAVVRDSATFATLWKTTWPDEPVPAVDFGSHTVLLVAMGERSSGGYSIQVGEVASEGYGLRAVVRSTAPGSGCAVTLALTQPVDCVSIPVVGAAARFVEESKVTRCD